MSNPSSGDRTPPEIITDEDWKSRVKEEDAKLDAELKAASKAEASESSEETASPSLPEASFLSLVQMLSTQAILGLGLLPGPDGKQRTELAVARHFIDLLGVLETKCRPNLTETESRVLEQTLHDLRMGYVEASRRA